MMDQNVKFSWMKLIFHRFLFKIANLIYQLFSRLLLILIRHIGSAILNFGIFTVNSSATSEIGN